MATVHANGIDIHYIEAGHGVPLLLLDNAMVSANPLWKDHPSAYVGHLDAFAAQFRTIVPDTRGSGQTRHPGGPITHQLLADDALALADALQLDRPMVCGFSDGGEVATIVALRRAGAIRAVVNHGGYDLFDPDPDAPGIMLTRQMLGGAPDATHADFAAIDRLAAGVPEMRAMFDLMRADHDAAQGNDHWQTVIRQTYERISRPHGHTADDLAQLEIPTLILTGDRDPFCGVEQGTRLYRALPAGELAVLPATGHAIDATAVSTTIEFLSRHATAA
jgi:pimeloyl-ACP methyl ester carboxylesterase